MSKKKDLLAAASKVVLSKGVSRLTLEAVAQEANVSKGGLLYHYPTKDALVKAMNVHVIESFRELIEEKVTSGYSYHQAYLLATLDSLNNESDLLDITTSLLAAISTNREVMELWREEYKNINKELSNEAYQHEYSLLVKAVCDGLWFAKLFDIGHINPVEEQKLIRYLLSMGKENSL